MWSRRIRSEAVRTIFDRRTSEDGNGLATSLIFRSASNAIITSAFVNFMKSFITKALFNYKWFLAATGWMSTPWPSPSVLLLSDLIGLSV